METYEVFRRSGHKDPFEHCGAVIAPDADMALLVAKECFLRRREGQHLWVVRRSDIHSFHDESLLEIAADKSYRFASAYRDVVKKRERARARAREVAST
ncbi:MAG TPA: 1,2-phenylacetyl-CoA epoxidase subunit B [Actinomycetota bacterium]|nr:1,2-phenylacetyl-CoA epoxidase subunit B [Actinomycetota bacterium]